MKNFLGLALIVAAFLFSTMQISLWAIFDTHSLVLVLGMTAGVLILKFGPKSLLFWKLNDKIREKVGAVGGLASLISGFIGALIGLIFVLSHLDEPAKIGPGVALAFVSVIYSMLLYVLVFLPMEADSKLVRKRFMIPTASLVLIMVHVGLVFVSLSMTQPGN